jgi:hypothetical protein
MAQFGIVREGELPTLNWSHYMMKEKLAADPDGFKALLKKDSSKLASPSPVKKAATSDLVKSPPVSSSERRKVDKPDITPANIPMRQTKCEGLTLYVFF